jgi:hypothetical protein
VYVRATLSNHRNLPQRGDPMLFQFLSSSYVSLHCFRWLVMLHSFAIVRFPISIFLRARNETAEQDTVIAALSVAGTLIGSTWIKIR